MLRLRSIIFNANLKIISNKNNRQNRIGITIIILMPTSDSKSHKSTSRPLATTRFN